MNDRRKYVKEKKIERKKKYDIITIVKVSLEITRGTGAAAAALSVGRARNCGKL